MNKLEEEVKEGTQNLVVLRNTLEKTDEDAAAAAGARDARRRGLKAAPRAVLDLRRDSLARREHINKLKADIKSLEEGMKRLQGGALDKAPAGERVKSFRGRGKRKYITGCR